MQTDSATVGSLIDSHQVQDLPLLGRNFVQLTQLVPGETDFTGGSFSTGNAVDDRRRPSAVSVNGFNGAQNNFMIDGMDNNERFIATVTVKPSIEAIGEIKVITNTFSAELSRANGAGISFITKSGTTRSTGRYSSSSATRRSTPASRFCCPRSPRRRTAKTISVAAWVGRSGRTRRFSSDWESYLVGQGQVSQLTVPLPSEIAGNFNTPGLTSFAGVAPIYDPQTTVTGVPRRFRPAAPRGRRSRTTRSR